MFEQFDDESALTYLVTLLKARPMFAVISPAKSLDYERPLPDFATATVPQFASEAEHVAEKAAKLSARKLSDLMHISDKLGKLNAERYRDFADAPTRAAIYAFNGDVYHGFEAKSLDEEAIAFAQDHLRILSGLYGLLRPLDAIKPYRLEMSTRWAPPARGSTSKNLYQWWDARIAAQLEAEMAEAGDTTVINIASQEYWQALGPQLSSATKVITIDFREHGPKGLRFNSFAAKRARGMMARYMCEHRLENPEALKQFDSDGYQFNASESTGNVWLFTRTLPTAA